MKSWMLPAVAGLFMVTFAARAETPVQAGLWEMTEKVTLEGIGEMPSAPKEMVCLKSGRATLEKILLPSSSSPEEAVAHGCKLESTPAGGSTTKLTLSCPAMDMRPAMAATLDIKYTPTSYEGVGKVEIKSKDGQVKGISTFSGKRVGDC